MSVIYLEVPDVKIFAITAALAALVFSSSAGACVKPVKPVVRHKPVPVVKIVKRSTPAIVSDRPVDVRIAQENRAGYCVNGRFTDLVLGQIDTDGVTVTWARFYKGVGITCDALPGYTFTGTYVDGFGGEGNYAYFA